MFHENTWKRAASGKPDLSLTSLSQSTFQQLLVQVFQNWGSPPGGLDAAGEQEPGGAGVQRMVGEVAEYSCGRLEAVVWQGGAVSGFVQRRVGPPTSGHQDAGQELGHLFAEVCWVEGSCAQRSETGAEQGDAVEHGPAVVPEAVGGLGLLVERLGEEEDERRVEKRASPNLVCIFWVDAFCLSFSLVWLLN